MTVLKHFSLLAALLVAQSGCQSSSLVARQIVLTDEAGTPRVFLDTTEAGTGLLIYDPQGKVRAGLNLIDDTSELSLADEAGTLRIVLAQRGERSTLTLVGASGAGRATLEVDEAGGRVVLLDPSGKDSFRQPAGR